MSLLFSGQVGLQPTTITKLVKITFQNCLQWFTNAVVHKEIYTLKKDLRHIDIDTLASNEKQLIQNPVVHENFTLDGLKETHWLCMHQRIIYTLCIVLKNCNNIEKLLTQKRSKPDLKLIELNGV